MSKCREVAGLLFKHECNAPAASQCARCHKPICSTHARGQGYGTTCIGCLREAAKHPAQRASMAHLRDDPYFFWYYVGADWFTDPYGAEDYALFDGNDGNFGRHVDREWHGS